MDRCESVDDYRALLDTIIYHLEAARATHWVIAKRIKGELIEQKPFLTYGQPPRVMLQRLTIEQIHGWLAGDIGITWCIKRLCKGLGRKYDERKYHMTGEEYNKLLIKE